MVKEIPANIFEEFEKSTESTLLIHQCNCFTTMGSGIAREIREKYPEAYQVDQKTIKGDRNKLGTCSFAKVIVAPVDKWVGNLYGQYNYGKDSRKTNYEAVYSGLLTAKNFCLSSAIHRILIPYKMSSNLAGGDFRIIRSMIDVVFESFPGNVDICNFEVLGYIK